MSTTSKKTKKKLIVIFGPPASGKTILAHALSKTIPNSVVIDDWVSPDTLPAICKAFKGRRKRGDDKPSGGAEVVILTSDTHPSSFGSLVPNLHTVIEMHSCKGPLLS